MRNNDNGFETEKFPRKTLVMDGVLQMENYSRWLQMENCGALRTENDTKKASRENDNSGR